MSENGAYRAPRRDAGRAVPRAGRHGRPRDDGLSMAPSWPAGGTGASPAPG